MTWMAESPAQTDITSLERRTLGTAQTTLLDILGDMVHPDDVAIPTAAFLAVMRDAGFSEPAVRQSIARGSSAGWIAKERNGRNTSWRLTPAGQTLVEDGIPGGSNSSPTPLSGMGIGASSSLRSPTSTGRPVIGSIAHSAGMGSATRCPRCGCPPHRPAPPHERGSPRTRTRPVVHLIRG